MNTHYRTSFALTLLFTFTTLWASGRPPWQCMVTDATHKEWVGADNYKRAAYNHAFESCKKESNLPATCKPTTECGSLYTGLSAHRMWRCSAIDHSAKIWRSSRFSDRDSAALAAKAFCVRKSRMPASCYVNVLMCMESRPAPAQMP